MHLNYRSIYSSLHAHLAGDEAPPFSPTVYRQTGELLAGRTSQCPMGCRVRLLRGTFLCVPGLLQITAVEREPSAMTDGGDEAGET
jgi:hypothetical protein